jgi:hypothetical protein
MLTFIRNFDGLLPALSAQGDAMEFATKGTHAFDGSPAKAGSLTTL